MGCVKCQTPNARQLCNGCLAVYCGASCQKADWSTHKWICGKLNLQFDATRNCFIAPPKRNLPTPDEPSKKQKLDAPEITALLEPWFSMLDDLHNQVSIKFVMLQRNYGMQLRVIRVEQPHVHLKGSDFFNIAIEKLKLFPFLDADGNFKYENSFFALLDEADAPMIEVPSLTVFNALLPHLSQPIQAYLLKQLTENIHRNTDEWKAVLDARMHAMAALQEIFQDPIDLTKSYGSMMFLLETPLDNVKPQSDFNFRMALTSSLGKSGMQSALAVEYEALATMLKLMKATYFDVHGPLQVAHRVAHEN